MRGFHSNKRQIHVEIMSTIEWLRVTRCCMQLGACDMWLKICKSYAKVGMSTENLSDG